MLAENYGAGVRPADFVGAPEESRRKINDWVADRTEDRIKDLIPPKIINTFTNAFNAGNADFSGINGRSCPGIGCLVIAAVIHKAFVSVDEEGTEAAAATAVVWDLLAGRPETISLAVDRPFIFLIRDRATKHGPLSGARGVADRRPHRICCTDGR